MAVAVFSMISCEETLDVDIFDSPPAIKIVSPGAKVVEGNFKLNVEFTDGANEETSLSPLASAAFSIMRSDSTTVVGSGNFSVSGIKTIIDQTFTNTLTPGNYFFNVSATDAKGNVTTTHKKFEIVKDFNSVSIIGDATPGGWGSDTNMTRNSSNPSLWEITGLVLTAGEAKFRANGNWTVNWGATGFPAGTGTQDGPNIPITAGTYKVTINVTTGAYTFQ
jgi:hypothetical protein